MVWRDVLMLTVGPRGCITGAKDCERRIAVSFRAVARLFHIAKNLIIGPVLFDDVDDVLDRRTTGKESGLSLAKQPVVAHDLLCVTCQRGIIRKVHGADVANDERSAVLPALSTCATAAGWKAFVRRVRRAAGVVND